MGIVLLLLVAAAVVLYVPSVRSAVLEHGVAIANEQTDYDIDIGHIYLSPFHHSPLLFYRAYQGQTDLPVEVRLDSVFVGHRGQDTLIYVHALRLRTTALTQSKTENRKSEILNVPIVLNHLRLESAAFHSDSLIRTVGVDVEVDSLEVASPQILIAKGEYPLHGLRLSGADVAIDLRKSAADTVRDSVPLRLSFEVPDGELRDVHFRLTPIGLDIRTDYLSTNASIDVGANRYETQRLNVGGFALSIGQLYLPVDTVYGTACADIANNLVATPGLHARSDAFGARADVEAAVMDLNTMLIDVVTDAEFQGSKAQVRGYYDIDDEAYNVLVNVEQVNLSPFLHDSTRIIVAGDIAAEGRGINPHSRAMRSNVRMHLTDAVYDNIVLSGFSLDARLSDQTVTGTMSLPVTITDSAMAIQAQTRHQFRVSDFMRPKRMGIDYHTQLKDLQAHVADLTFMTDSLRLDFVTDTATSLSLSSPGMQLTMNSPRHVLQWVDSILPLFRAVSDSVVIRPVLSLTDLTIIDTLRHLVPDMNMALALSHGSPVQPVFDSLGLDIRQFDLSFASDSLQTGLSLLASTPDIEHPNDSAALRLPPANASLNILITEGHTAASLLADTRLTDGVMNVYDLCADAAFRMEIERVGNSLHGDGRLTFDSLAYGNMELGNHAVDILLSPSLTYEHALRADVQLDDIPLDIVESFVSLPEMAIRGAVRASASVDGLPRKKDISAEVQPLGVSAEYKPYQIAFSLGKTPIIMSHNHVDLNGLPIYAVDSTYLALYGGLNLDSMRLDITLSADSFAPVKLTKDGPIPVYGDLATDIQGSITGPLDSIVADVTLTLLSVTDITYPIDKKNLAQVKPHGTVTLHIPASAIDSLSLVGKINVDDGFVRYSPKVYPIMPFRVDSGSHILFQGPIGQTRLDVSASQCLKADVESNGEETRRVDFTTGVRVHGEIDSIGLHSIDFFLEAPNDETITRELASVDDDTREGLAATLLATGMYVGESNVAAQRDGYALSSIVNSRINAAMANSKMGKKIDVDFSSGQSTHASGKTNDMNISISKSFLKDKLRITLGSTLTDNPEINKTNGFFTNFSADYKLTKDGNVLLRLFSQRDYNNILEGELYKSGLAVRAFKEWKKKSEIYSDSITRTYGLTADAGVAYRSNNSIGPDLTLKSTIKNLLGHGEQFTLKANGAYFWALRNRHPGDPKKTDTYKLGANASLIFPYLHWGAQKSTIPEGDTRYMLGYQYENIAGGYGVHKLSGSFTYFIRSPFNPYITHAFTPLSLSVVLMKAETDSLLDKAAEYPQLIKVLAGDEFVPSIGYNFIYDDYRSRRAVNTFLNLGVKESGNLINALYCVFGHQWDTKEKSLGRITFNQFVKLTAELRNKFNITDQVCIATRLFAGANIPLGNSHFSPLSEAFYTGGPNSLRAASPYAYGPGNFYSAKYNQNFFHSGDFKLEANFELRFPIVWKLYGAAFVDAGNVWNWYSTIDLFKAAGFADYLERLEIPEDLHDGVYNNPDFARQIALGTGAGLRLDLDGLVIRLDIGVAIHSPYQTFRYDKSGKPDLTRPIHSYYNIPSVLDAIRINFGIGYPF
ncbi:MAG: BamA/TamA family outer membrane protein [Paludibacteraceae bacterium]|nr:BamA/TamA family outer membrane protein [Paludibacteraceae bacterium]